jgi:ubiquinone/menaquinone biosynthesis C-methylase UbiE
MSKAAIEKIGDNYVLPTGVKDASRLDLIHLVYSAVSYRGVQAAGIGPGMRVADIGCGTGTMTRWLAAQVGDLGVVSGIDIAPAQIDVAQSVTMSEGAAPIAYKVGSAYHPELEHGSYDLVFCRLVLCHLTDPYKAVSAMAQLLKPGGRLILVDMDLRSVFAMPSSPFYEHWHAVVVPQHEKNIGVDYSIGTRLAELMTQSSLLISALFIDQPAFQKGAEKHLWDITRRTAAPYLVAAETVTQVEVERLLEGMSAHTARPDVWVAVAKMFAAVGVKQRS